MQTIFAWIIRPVKLANIDKVVKDLKQSIVYTKNKNNVSNFVSKYLHID